jgi:hypothetical protein
MCRQIAARFPHQRRGFSQDASMAFSIRIPTKTDPLGLRINANGFRYVGEQNSRV